MNCRCTQKEMVKIRNYSTVLDSPPIKLPVLHVDTFFRRYYILFCQVFKIAKTQNVLCNAVSSFKRYFKGNFFSDMKQII